MQDLDHSLVKYNATDAAIKLQLCLDWQRRMLHNARKWVQAGLLPNSTWMRSRCGVQACLRQACCQVFPYHACSPTCVALPTSPPRLRYELFTTSISATTLHKHAHISPLFWGYDGVEPSLKLSGPQNLGALIRDSQLAQLRDHYPTVAGLRHIYLEPAHAQFHLFRKLVRCVGQGGGCEYEWVCLLRSLG